MPNVSPRGLWAFRDGAWRQPTDVFAKKADGTWCQAKYVWTFKDGTWQVIFASVVDPAQSATATWVPAGTSVTVAWVLPVVNTAASWRVIRPDGSLAGTVGGAVTTFSDPSPLPMVGTYKVQAVAGSLSSALTATNSLDLTLQAATATVALSGSDAVVTWTANAIGDPDTWQVFNVTLGAWAATGIPGATHSATIVGLTPGVVYEFQVVPILSGQPGTGKATTPATIGVPAAVPSSVVLAAQPVPNAGTLRLTWSAPAAGVATSYEVETSTDGAAWAAAPSDVSPSDWPVGEGVNGWMRVRTVAAGGVSPWVERGPVLAATRPLPDIPTSVTLVALTSPVDTLRLTWAAGASGASSYEVETSLDGSTWTGSADDVSPSDLTHASAVNGWMRVRALLSNTSYNGASAWVTKGPVAFIHDITPPANATITSWKPETSYGRMVVRFTTPTSGVAPDLNSYKVQQRLAGGTFVDVGGWVAAANNTAYAVVCSTRSAGQVAEVKVLLRDDVLNTNTGDTATYTLAATPILVDPSGDKSGTWRIGTSTSDWRNDSSRAANEIATGWTSSGPNIGCFIYGTTIDAALGTRTIVSATIQYYRENEAGLGAAVAPLFWTHDRTSRSGAPTVNAQGVAEASRVGPGCVRATPNDTAVYTLPAAFITALQAGTAKGICMYRNYVGSGDPDQYYGFFGIGDVSNNGVVNGRLTFSHLG